MEDAKQQSLDRFASISSHVDRAVERLEPHNLTEQPLSPRDERVVSANTSPDAAITGASRNTENPTFVTSGVPTSVYPLNNSYTPQEQGYFYGGFDNGSGTWDERSNYVNANNLQIIPPAMYNDNTSLFFPPGYAFDSPMGCGQFPPPLSPIMFDGQLFSPHQMPVNQPFYPPSLSPGPPHVTSASQTELKPPGQENHIDNSFFGTGSGYYLPFGSFSGGDSVQGPYKKPGQFGSSKTWPNQSSSLDTSSVYPQPIGILGSYEQNYAQAPFQSFGLTSNSIPRNYSYRNRFSIEKGGRREPASISTDTLDRNRGPRASKPKSIKDVESTSGFHVDQLNSPDLVTHYERAKIFVIKSFSEDNVHKSIKYSVWSSTPLGNKKLDSAYREAKEMDGNCPLFLFFSVNTSGQFCGVAEMVGPVDFDHDADYWQQDRWSGKFPVKWHIIKDVPNSLFRHIIVESNDNKPVTHSRDSQEVQLEQGLEMLKIFKTHEAEASLLDDFNFYDAREKSLQERKVKHRDTSTVANTANESLNQLSDNLADTLRLDGGKKTDLE